MPSDEIARSGFNSALRGDNPDDLTGLLEIQPGDWNGSSSWAGRRRTPQKEIRISWAVEMTIGKKTIAHELRIAIVASDTRATCERRASYLEGRRWILRYGAALITLSLPADHQLITSSSQSHHHLITVRPIVLDEIQMMIK